MKAEKLLYDKEYIRTHISSVMEGAPLTMLPFPHLTLQGFFPDDVYERILKLNPFLDHGGTPWRVTTAPDRAGTKMPYAQRKHIDLIDMKRLELSGTQIDFWGMLRDVFLSDDWFLRLVVDRFPSYFELRFGGALLRPEFRSKLQNALFLQRHDPGYFIGPHTDVPSRIFTCLFAFADSAGFEEYGTQILRPRSGDICCSGRLHYGFEAFEVIKTIPYRPNQFLLFFKTRHSFHSVKQLKGGPPNGRFGMQFQCLEPNHGVLRDISHPDILCPRATEAAVANLSAEFIARASG